MTQRDERPIPPSRDSRPYTRAAHSASAQRYAAGTQNTDRTASQRTGSPDVVYAEAVTIPRGARRDRATGKGGAPMTTSRKLRYILDAVMLVIMTIMFAYSVTGNAVHEYLGESLFVLAIVHCVINRKWFKALSKMFRNAKGRPKQQIWIATDLVLVAGMLLCAISSIIISTTVFAALNIPYLGAFWAVLHRWSFYISYGAVAVHFGLHWQAFASRVFWKVPSVRVVVGRTAATALTVLVVLLGIGAYRSNYIAIANAAQTTRTQNSQPFDNNAVADSTPSSSSSSSGTTSSSASSGSTPPSSSASSTSSSDTKSQYSSSSSSSSSSTSPLDGQYCTQCGKHCPLTAPQCSKGVALAQKILNGS